MDRHPQNPPVASRLPRGLLLLGVGLLLLARPSTAHASDDSLAVLGIETVEVSDAVGLQLTEALRRKAAETPGVKLVSGKDLVELKMVFGCDGEAPACLAQAGRTIGADRLLYGTLKKAEGGRSILVSLKLLDVRDLAIVKQVTETVPKKALAGATLTADAARWFGQLIVPPQSGVIMVQTQPAEANVDLDGTPAGRTPVRLKDLRPGTHTLTLQLEGYLPRSETVELAAGATERVSVKLEHEQRAEPIKPKVIVEPMNNPDVRADAPAKPRHPGRPAKYAAIGLVAGGVVAGAVAIYTWRSYIKLQDQAHADLQSIAASPGVDSNTAAFLAAPRCDNISLVPGAMRDAYASHCASGNRYANATTGLWATAGVLAAGGIISFIIGESLDARAEKARQRGLEKGLQPGIKESLRLVPALSTTGGGLQASFEF